MFVNPLLSRGAAITRPLTLLTPKRVMPKVTCSTFRSVGAYYMSSLGQTIFMCKNRFKTYQGRSFLLRWLSGSHTH